MTTSIPLNDFDFELPPEGLGSEIVELIDIDVLAGMAVSNSIFTHSANISPSGGGVALFNATALQKGLTETVTFSLLDTDDYDTEGALMMAILTSLTQLQTGRVAVVEFKYFELISSPIGPKLPITPDSIVQWEQDDIGGLLRTLQATVKEYFQHVG